MPQTYLTHCELCGISVPDISGYNVVVPVKVLDFGVTIAEFSLCPKCQEKVCNIEWNEILKGFKYFEK